MKAHLRAQNAVRERVRRSGWDVVRFPGSHPGHRRQLLLAGHGVDLVVDVGANVGQYGRQLRAFGYTGRILSFEPMSAEFAQLSAQAGADPGWTVVRSAVGAEPGEVVINISANSISSSLLPMLDLHAEVAPNSRYVATETVPVERLDRLAHEAVRTAKRPHLKIDVQGFERFVLDGATGIMADFVGAEIELCLAPLYAGQLLITDLIELMRERGFRLVGLADVLSDGRTGETLAVDGIFLREGP